MNTKPKLTHARNLSLSDADYESLRKMGKGNASEGVRVAIRAARGTVNDKEQTK